jgi:predicted Zn-dependent protease with MMP-like domain
VYDVPLEQFEALVAEAMDSLPEELSAGVENVVVLVEEDAPEHNLFGLYQGVPITGRASGYAGHLPDRITLYRAAICRACTNAEEVRAQVRKTLIHEVGHYYGLSDPRLKELGWA